jgi:hypothetical protein
MYFDFDNILDDPRNTVPTFDFGIFTSKDIICQIYSSMHEEK